MRQVRTDIMGMPIIVEVPGGTQADLDAVFDYFVGIDRRFSTYKNDSEVSRLNRGELVDLSPPMQEVLELAELTKRQTGGFFDIRRPDLPAGKAGGLIDPSGIVKGWAIRGAARLLAARGITDFYLDAGGDIQTGGRNARGQEWCIGVRSPFKREDVIKVLEPRGRGVATSGSSARGAHIYNPLLPGAALDEVVSITVLGPDVLEADRFATAAFAMGRHGVEFIEALSGLEAYQVDQGGIATMTSGFSRYTV